MYVHLQLAEAGKRHMLVGDHRAALERLRVALRHAVQHRAPGVFLHHYTECILDCLEASGDHAQALELTERALDDQDAAGDPLGEAVRSSLVERRILLLFALGREVEGDAALADPTAPATAALAAVGAARRRRLHLDARRIQNLKQLHSPSAVTAAHLRSADAARGEAFFRKEHSYA